MTALGTTETETDEMTGERIRSARRILVEAALLGVLADGAIRNAPEGLGWTIWVLGLSFVAVMVAKRAGRRVTLEQLAWLGAAVTFAAAFAWRAAEELNVFNVFATLVALTMFAMSADGRPATSILVARIRDVIAAGVYTVRDIIIGAPVLAASDAELHTLPAVERGHSWTAVRALLITLPLVLVFAMLLSQADPVFASIFRLPNAEQLFSHVFIAGAFAWWSAGYIRGALLGVARRPAVPDIPIRLGSAEITTALGSVLVLFAIFVGLQVRWLFGGADVVLATTGLTVAEYARRGFFELVAVALLVVPLILGSRALIEDEKTVRRHRAMSLALIVLLMPIMASALLRMKLYVDHFGLTTDRLYAMAMMAWLGIVFIAMARTVLRGWARPFAAMTVISAFATLFTLNVVSPDQLVARVNLGRPSTERGIDYEYLARLHGDAVPTVVRGLKSAAPSLSSCKAAAFLRERWLERSVGWNLGARKARSAVVADLGEPDVQRLCVGVPAITPPTIQSATPTPQLPNTQRQQ